MVIQESIRLGGIEYNKKHLEIISALLPTNLTPTEMEVLASFMALDKSLTEDSMFNTVARKRVMLKMNLSAGGLSNHLKSMINKKVLDKDDITKKITMKKFLFPDSKMQGYQIKIIKQ